MKVLVTGANGQLGYDVVKELQNKILNVMGQHVKILILLTLGQHIL